MPLSYTDVLELMTRDLNLLAPHLNSIIRTAPLRYKSFKIPKRDGKWRVVAQPAKEVKAVQRWLISKLLDVLPVHEVASAYRTGRSIRFNAAMHVESNYMLKVDFEQFFPSIKKADIKRHLQCVFESDLSPETLEMVAHCMTWAPTRSSQLELCIGAPTSPLISNSILFDFDRALFEYCRENAISYSRYADDLTFSCAEKGKLDRVLERVRETLERLEYPRIRINERKTVFASRRSRRQVTGLVLTPDHKISVGRERKRLIRAMYHRFIRGELGVLEIERLNGLIAFVDSIEPGFAHRLKASVKAGDMTR